MNSANYRYLNKAKTHLKRIGITVVSLPSTVPDPLNSFTVGCWIDRGIIYYVAKRCLVGALIHEAGHLALIPRLDWERIAPGCLSNSQVSDPFAGAGELAAEAWGYAFANFAGIPIENAVHSLSSIATVRYGDSIESPPVDSNKPGYFFELSQGEFNICMQLLNGQHLGIKLLQLADFAGKEYPQLNYWTWDNRICKCDLELLKPKRCLSNE